MMELLHHYKEIQDINISALIRCTERLANEYNDETFERIQRVIGYPKWTIAFLREVLDFHRIPNQLNRYLSALTNYPIPKMQDLYEITRQQSCVAGIKSKKAAHAPDFDQENAPFRYDFSTSNRFS